MLTTTIYRITKYHDQHLERNKRFSHHILSQHSATGAANSIDTRLRCRNPPTRRLAVRSSRPEDSHTSFSKLKHHPQTPRSNAADSRYPKRHHAIQEITHDRVLLRTDSRQGALWPPLSWFKPRHTTTSSQITRLPGPLQSAHTVQNTEIIHLHDLPTSHAMTGGTAHIRSPENALLTKERDEVESR